MSHIANTAQPPAYGEWNKDLLSNTLNNFDHGIPAFGCSTNIEKDQLIGALRVVESGKLFRIASIAELGEAGAFNNSTCCDIKAGD